MIKINNKILKLFKEQNGSNSIVSEEDLNHLSQSNKRGLLKDLETLELLNEASLNLERYVKEKVKNSIKEIDYV